MSGACPACGTLVLVGEAFCEQCGHALGVAGCTACGAPAVGADGYCENCGMLQPSGRDHVEIELEIAAGVSDRGLRHSRNEDAMALTAAGTVAGTAAGTAAGTVAVGVVCDGVSTSLRPEEASQTAVDTAVAALAKQLGEGADPETATREAVRLAAEAVFALAEQGEDAPACTYVSAVVGGRQVTVGWVGDSRAYWLGSGSEVLTGDDATPGTHMLTAWLGADAGEVVPHIRTFTPDGPGVVLLCSDGLWNYYPEPATLAAVALNATPRAAAQRLVRLALEAGGHDNITVVVIPFGPGDQAEATVVFPKEQQ
ncbi:PP2C family serine/threonine-protein phosphatase [Microtetraspora sp. NBRC 16547]|uniref:PP2C family serine/threonine-protein phosphatase n=1 Tax=Microtetraspora sp. NBRC 16547 TaxID=3030993 RepID=UPI0025545EFF|nr:PP2C family serine/threonine-protein phosphatase [Microtetraspora sp. NBRC 16547]